MSQVLQVQGDLSNVLKVRWIMSPEELLQVVYSMIDRCFARGMELGEVLVEIETYIASLET